MQMFGPNGQSRTERSNELCRTGPIIDVYASNPVLKPFNNGEFNYKASSKRLSALIDTGASINCIHLAAAKVIGLLQVDERQMSHAMGSGKTPVYIAELYIPQIQERVSGEFYGVDLGSAIDSNGALLGTPFLQDYIFNYNGHEGQFTLVKPKDIYKSPSDA